jgi:5-methylcytosine-specific restriction endonuclease McrA
MIGFIMKQREVWIRKYTPIQEKRIAFQECPNCGLHKSKWKRRTDWTCCSKKCSDEFYKSNLAVLDWKEFRLKAFKRDDYTCAICKKRNTNTSSLIGDHIIPISCGGMEFDLDNIQTLCWECNKKKTKSDMKTIAYHRKCEKLGIKITEQEKLLKV